MRAASDRPDAAPGERGGERAALLLIAGGLLLLFALFAPWAFATEGILLNKTSTTGWAWFSEAGRVTFVVALALISCTLLSRTGRGPPPRPLRLVTGAAAAACFVFVVKGLEDQQRAVQELGRTVDVNFSPDVAGAPALALLGLAMALVGSMAPRTSRGRLDVRAWVSSAALLLIAAAMFMDWTWTAGDDLRPAWEIYEWADSAVIALAALTVVLAGWQPRPALLAVPILAGIMPFVEYGFLGTTPGGFQAPAGMDGSPIGIGVPIALLGLVLAASMVARTAAVDAGYRRFSSAFMVAVVFTAGVVTLAYPTYGLSSALTAIFAAGIAALAAFVLVAQLRSRDSGYEERRRTVGRSGDQ